MEPILYLVRIPKPIEEPTFRFLLQFSPPEKQERILRQRVKQNADAMVVGAALARHMIFQVFHIPLSKQRIAYGPYGKPYLPDYPNAHFNISHSGQYVACAVSDRPVGVDVQEITPYRPDVAKLVCTPEEILQIETSPDPAAEFTTLWTKKEAYGKMMGCGIDPILLDHKGIESVLIKTYPLDNAFLSFCFVPGPNGEAGCRG